MDTENVKLIIKLVMGVVILIILIDFLVGGRILEDPKNLLNPRVWFNLLKSMIAGAVLYLMTLFSNILRF